MNNILYILSIDENAKLEIEEREIVFEDENGNIEFKNNLNKYGNKYSNWKKDVVLKTEDGIFSEFKASTKDKNKIGELSQLLRQVYFEETVRCLNRISKFQKKLYSEKR